MMTATLELVLRVMNRMKSGTGSVDAVKHVFEAGPFAVFTQYTARNRPVTARKRYEPQMIEREQGAAYDVRSIMVKVDVGETEAGTVLQESRRHAFSANSYISMRFDEFTIVRHEKLPWLYGVSCFQQWNSSRYADKGHLFLMMDFRDPKAPVIHVRTWQPKAFDDGQYVTLDDFEIVGSN